MVTAGRQGRSSRGGMASRFGGGAAGRGGMSSRFGGGGSRFGGGGGDSGRRGATADSGRPASYKQPTAAEMLPDGLPGWYEDIDSNVDGQVAMHEFSKQWNDRALENYYEFDLNKDGIITPTEALEAVDQGASRGDFGSSSGSSRFSKSRRSGVSFSVKRETIRNQTASSSKAKSSSGSQDKYAKLAAGYLKRIDKDGDGVLNKAEQANMKFYQKSDHDGDGNITVDELAKTMSGFKK